MKHTLFTPIALLMFAVIFTSCDSTDKPAEETSKYSYTSVEGDPMGTRIYTLDNGLKVYISENHAEPRVQTNIAVRTGSKQDPADATGLAHYLEHMLFKGTSKLGSVNWEEEKKYLKMISDKYEEHRATTDPEERKALYHQIDSLSQIAASYVAPNEYDRLISGMGAQGTNAYTSNERTVYINDIPSNEFEKWLAVESERFNELVLRLFHTELEAVYEEFNRGQDSDFRLAYYKMLDMLFPNHPYGQQTTIGTSEHLKAPSMEKIHDYFSRRYVPNNMAVILSGDINPEEAIAMVDKYFGGYESKPLEKMTMPKESPITEPQIADVMGSDAEFEMVSYRLGGAKTKDPMYLELLSGVLNNGTAGLIDLNLIQSQKILKARVNATSNEDYSWLSMTGYARNGQSLEEVRELLMEQIDLVKEGSFDDWMIDAVVRKYKKDMMNQMEYNWIRAYNMSDAFILNEDWEKVVSWHDDMQKITKEELMAWTKKNFGENYVAVNKRVGEKDVTYVDKPEITAIDINRDTNSTFFLELEKMPSSRLKPQFVEFKSSIQSGQLKNGLAVQYVENKENDLFDLYYVVDMGTDHDKELAMAVKYLPYLGTADMSPAEVQKELFKLGVSFDVFSARDKSYIMLSGLNETFADGVKFFEELMNNVVADQNSYNELVNGMLKERSDAKLSKSKILNRAMRNYAMYGPENPYNEVIPEATLKSMDPSKLTDKINTLTNFEHRVLYYGHASLDEVVQVMNEHHTVAAEMAAIPAPKKYEQIATDQNKVYFIDYDMVQTELMLLHRGPEFNDALLAPGEIFGEYFGGGLSSIVFQEIRESKALAYSAYAGFSDPDKKEEHHYVRGYIGTQSNKLGDATDALLELMNEMPKADKQFEQAKLSALKQIETNRTNGRSILWAYEEIRDLGMEEDYNKIIYPAIESMDFAALEKFFNEQIKGKTFVYLVIGKKGDVNMKALEKLGPVTELDLETVFGY